MKIRNDFISNSRSSSFILATDKDSSKIKFEITLNIKDIATEVITNIEELDAYYLKLYSYSIINTVEKILHIAKNKNDFIIYLYNKIKEKINKGKIVLICENCNDKNTYFYYNDLTKLKGNFEVIQDCIYY